MCDIDAAAGEPQFAITTEGDGQEQVEILAEHAVSIQDLDSFNGHHFAALLIFSNVSIMCRVTDDTGTYVVNGYVTLKGRVHQ